MVIILLQVFAGLCALLGLGYALDKDATKFDRIAGFGTCLVYLIFILIIQVVIK